MGYSFIQCRSPGLAVLLVITCLAVIQAMRLCDVVGRKLIRIDGPLAIQMVTEFPIKIEGETICELPKAKFETLSANYQLAVLEEQKDTIKTAIPNHVIALETLCSISLLLTCETFDYLSPYAKTTEPFERQQQLARFAMESELHNTIFHPLKLLHNVNLARAIFIDCHEMVYTGSFFDSSVPLRVIRDFLLTDMELGKAIFRHVLTYQMHKVRTYDWLLPILWSDEIDAKELLPLVPASEMTGRFIAYFADKLPKNEFLKHFKLNALLDWNNLGEMARLEYKEGLTPNELVLHANLICGSFFQNREMLSFLVRPIKTFIVERWKELKMIAKKRGDRASMLAVLELFRFQNPFPGKEKAKWIKKILKLKLVTPQYLSVELLALRAKGLSNVIRWEGPDFDEALDQMPLQVRLARLLKRISVDCTATGVPKIDKRPDWTLTGQICVNGVKDDNRIAEIVIGEAKQYLASSDGLTREMKQHIYRAVFYSLVERRKLDLSRMFGGSKSIINSGWSFYFDLFQDVEHELSVTEVLQLVDTLELRN